MRGLLEEKDQLLENINKTLEQYQEIIDKTNKEKDDLSNLIQIKEKTIVMLEENIEQQSKEVHFSKNGPPEAAPLLNACLKITWRWLDLFNH